MHKHFKKTITTFFLFVAFSLTNSAFAAYDMIVMPVMPAKELKKAYAPLTQYLSKTTGQKINLVTSPNYLAYWQRMKKGEYDLVLDAAHLVDFRVKKLDYDVLAKVKDKVSFSIVSAGHNPILDPDELIGKQVACMVPPSRGGLQIDQYYPNLMRQPIKVQVDSFEEAVYKLNSGQVDAAVIPTPLLNKYTNLNVIESTELWPHMGLTASPSVPDSVKASIKKALTDATFEEKRTQMLASAGMSGFELADNTVYDGYIAALKNSWGFKD